MTKTVLLLGASGLLGTDLYKTLVHSNHQVIAPSHAQVDLSDFSSLTRIILAEKIDVIINAAAIVDVNALEKNPEAGLRTNADGAGNIAKIIAERSLSVVYLMVSTNYVFGTRKRPYAEDELPAPVNAYGTSKAAGEQLVAAYCKAAGSPYFIVRTGWLYGAARPTFVDEVAKTLRSGEEYNASADQRGNPTATHDFSKAVVEEFVVKRKGSGIYHVVNETPEGNGVSRYQIACEVASVLGVAHTHVHSRKSDELFSVERPSAVLRNTKLPPLRDWREALRDHFGNASGLRRGE